MMGWITALLASELTRKSLGLLLAFFTIIPTALSTDLCAGS